MSKENGNGKVIVIATIVCVIIGLFFVFGIDKKITTASKKLFSKKQTVSTFDITNSEFSYLADIPNAVFIYGGVFSDEKISIKSGEVVSFFNLDQSPIKIIGEGWQSAFIDFGGAFAKGDFEKGEYTAYIEGKPNVVVKIIVK